MLIRYNIYHDNHNLHLHFQFLLFISKFYNIFYVSFILYLRLIVNNKNKGFG